MVVCRFGRRKDKLVSKRGTPTVYEVNFITPTLALSLLASGPSPKAHETLCVVVDVMRRIGGDGPSRCCA